MPLAWASQAAGLPRPDLGPPAPRGCRAPSHSEAASKPGQESLKAPWTAVLQPIRSPRPAELRTMRRGPRHFRFAHAVGAMRAVGRLGAVRGAVARAIARAIAAVDLKGLDLEPSKRTTSKPPLTEAPSAITLHLRPQLSPSVSRFWGLKAVPGHKIGAHVIGT